jgi:hypothetical protein
VINYEQDCARVLLYWKNNSLMPQPIIVSPHVKQKHGNAAGPPTRQPAAATHPITEHPKNLFN